MDKRSKIHEDKLNRCYALRQKAFDPAEYCYGDSQQFPAFNPWGCIQVKMPLSNDTEWLCYGKFDTDGTWIFNKEKIAHYLKVNTEPFKDCPALNLDKALKILKAFPETVNPKIDKDWKYAYPIHRHLSVSLSFSVPNEDGETYVCGVKPASPIAVKNIYNKILAKL